MWIDLQKQLNVGAKSMEKQFDKFNISISIGRYWKAPNLQIAIATIKCLMPLGRYSGWVWESYVCI